jgi:hypothetical protein
VDSATLSVVSALAGSAIGAGASFATTWLTQHSQLRAQRSAQAIAVRQALFIEFIDEASKSLTDALTHELDDPSKLVRLYASIGKLRLFASDDVVSKAELAMRQIVAEYERPVQDFNIDRRSREHRADALRAFSEACREDLAI